MLQRPSVGMVNLDHSEVRYLRVKPMLDFDIPSTHAKLHR